MLQWGITRSLGHRSAADAGRGRGARAGGVGIGNADVGFSDGEDAQAGSDQVVDGSSTLGRAEGGVFRGHGILSSCCPKKNG